MNSIDANHKVSQTVDLISGEISQELVAMVEPKHKINKYYVILAIIIFATILVALIIFFFRQKVTKCIGRLLAGSTMKQR